MNVTMHTFMSTCKENGAHEMAWFTDVLGKIQSHNHKERCQLLANN